MVLIKCVFKLVFFCSFFFRFQLNSELCKLCPRADKCIHAETNDTNTCHGFFQNDYTTQRQYLKISSKLLKNKTKH